MKLHPITIPGGSDTYVQYNNGGIFGGSADLIINDATGVTTATGLTVTNCAVLGLNSAVFQPTADAVDFFKVNDEDGNVITTVDTVNNRLDVTNSDFRLFDTANQVRNFRIYRNSVEIGGFNANNQQFTFRGASGKQIQFNANANSIGAHMTVDTTGFVGIKETIPETLLELTHAQPCITTHCSTQTDDADGRASVWQAFGEQGVDPFEETTLGKQVFAHDGAGADDKGYWALYTNDGSDGDAPTLRMKVDSTGATDVVGDFTAGTI